jgi:hypothetical protein
LRREYHPEAWTVTSVGARDRSGRNGWRVKVRRFWPTGVFPIPRLFVGKAEVGLDLDLDRARLAACPR